ncbi:TonB-dependent siderophore receptor [Variovorax sp. GB1P17]|uniref:TonB-dependent siderophore receptor n=1 Tax=Variovorax sp. GB1P17 TaxID=3443740 RepID=UPI003F461485
MHRPRSALTRFDLAPLALAVALSLGSFAVQAQTTPAVPMDIAVTAQPLAQALTELARQAQLTLMVPPALVAGRTAPAVSGRLTPQQALDRLLVGNGLMGIQEGNVVVVKAIPSAAGTTTLPVVTVTAASDSETAGGRVRGYVAKQSATATKTDTPILEIPQTINVVTADEISSRGAISITQALRYTAGVNTNGFTDANMIADEITSRGFAPAPLYLDGAYLPYAGSLGGSLQIEPYSLERVEVLKGPASVLYGQNQPGGIINMVTKKPSDDPVREVRVGIASYGRVEGAMDLGGALNDDKTLSYRLLALANGGDQQIDYTKSKRTFLAPSITWKPSGATSLTLYAQVQEDSGVPDYQSLPTVGTLYPGPNGQTISRNFFTGDPAYNHFHRKQYVIGEDFSHRISDSLQVRQSLRFVDVKDDYKGFYLSRFVTASGVTDYSRANRVKLDWPQHNNVLSLDNNVEFKTATGAVSHTLLAGLDYRRFSRKYDGYNNYAAEATDLYQPNHGTSTSAVALTTRWDNTVDQVGLYVQDQMKWDRFVLTVGGRQDWARIDNKDLIANSRTQVNDDAFTGRIGLTYLADNGVAPYVSYSESFLPVVGTDYAGKAFKPTTGKQIEAGLKYQPPGRNALVTASVFEIRQQNLATQDYDHPQYQVQQGEVRSRGAEIEAKAQLASGLDLVAALSYTDARTTRSNYASSLDKQLVLSAPWAASLWANYRVVGGPLNGVQIGGGVRWTGSKYGDAANTFRTPAFAVFDAALRYDLGLFDPSLRGIEAALNIQNLFDKTYLSNCNYSFGCYYGKARTVSASATYRW